MVLKLVCQKWYDKNVKLDSSFIIEIATGKLVVLSMPEMVHYKPHPW